jgi:hypothetical protein
MCNIICQRCLKKFTTISNLKRHIKNKKKICKINGVNVSNKIMLNQLEKKSEYICNNCNKKFNYNKNYTKHKCQSSITNLSNTLHEQTKLLNNLLNNNEKIIEIVNNTLNITNQNNINITINDFGNEDISHITNEFILNIISKMNRSSLLKYIKAVHCDNPYNLNIILPNKTQKIILVWKNGEWILDNKKTIIDDIIVKNFDRINDVYETIENKLPKYIQEEYTYYADTFDNSDKERNEIQKDTECLFSKYTINI